MEKNLRLRIEGHRIYFAFFRPTGHFLTPRLNKGLKSENELKKYHIELQEVLDGIKILGDLSLDTKGTLLDYGQLSKN